MKSLTVEYYDVEVLGYEVVCLKIYETKKLTRTGPKTIKVKTDFYFVEENNGR